LENGSLKATGDDKQIQAGAVSQFMSEVDNTMRSGFKRFT